MSRRETLQQLLVPAFVLILLPTLPGCLFPFAVPKVSQTPLLNLGAEADQIHAFRVDVTTNFVDIGGMDYLTFSEIAPSSGWLLPRTKLSSTYGAYVFGVALNYPLCISHSLGLKLYRPGYELVELESWEQPRKIDWNEAPDLASQLVANGSEDKIARARLETKASKLREQAAPVEPPPSLRRSWSGE